ncbi:MAG: nicotinamide mononucleotide transporter, partial [Clostridia bacterium]|nr:nicotinamide mononucleotide transporter [Clostridia bacterium]
MRQIKTKKKLIMPLLLGAAAILITVTGIVFGQSPLRILPLYISLVIGLLQSRVSRIAPLIGGINALLYAAVYLYYGLYASALYAVLVSCPMQIATFFSWRKRAYGQSVVFRRMSLRGRLLTALGFAACWAAMWAIMSALGSSYRVFDNTVTLLGILITVLTMFAYIEYTVLMIPSGLCSLGLYI